MRIDDVVKDFLTLQYSDQLSLVQDIRRERMTSKAVLKKTSTKQRSRKMSAFEALLESMSDEERNAFLEKIGA